MFSKLSRVFFEVGLVRILVVIVQLFFIKIITNKLQIDELGLFYFLSTLSYILNAILFVPVDYFQQAKLYELKKNEISIRSYIPINKLIFKYVFLVLIVLNIVLCLFNSKYVFIANLIVLMSLGTYLTTFIRGVVNNLEKRRCAIYNVLFESVLKILIFYIFTLFFKPTSQVVLLSLLLASYVSLGPLLYFIKSLKEFKYIKEISFDFAAILKFSLPITVSSIINLVQVQGYRLILVPLGFTNVVGIYGTVANVGSSGLAVASTIYSQIFVPNIYKTKGKFILSYFKGAILTVLIVSFVGFFLSSYIIRLLTNPTFVVYSNLILFGIINEAGNFITGSFTIYMTLNKLNGLILKISIYALILFVVIFLVLFLLQKINAYTVGIPILLTQLFVVCIQGFFVFRHYKTVL